MYIIRCRYPEVKESGSTQGERRLITLSAKFSHEGPGQTNTDRDRGSVKSGIEASTEGHVVNITPRKDSRGAASSELPSFAQQINSLAQSTAADTPPASSLQALYKSEEYLSDEASRERSSEGQSAEDSREGGKSLTVEEVDIDFLRRLNSQSANSESSPNRFRFTPRVEEKAATQATTPFSHYRIGTQLQGTSSPTLNAPAVEEGYRQAKLIQELTTPKPLIFQIPQDYKSSIDSYESGPSRSRTRGETNSNEYKNRNDASNSRYRGGMRHSAEAEDDRIPEQAKPSDDERFSGPSSSSHDYRGRGPIRSDEARENKQQTNHNTQVKNEQLSLPMTYSPTPSPLRITVAPLTDGQIKEQVLKQYKSNLENSRLPQSEQNWRGAPASRNESPRTNLQSTKNIPNFQSEDYITPKDSVNNDQSRRIASRLPEKSVENQPPKRERLMPYSDFVNSNVKTMMEAANKNEEPASSEEEEEEEQRTSVEEQASEEARKPVAIRIPDSLPQRNTGETNQYNDPRQHKQEDYSRKPIRYSDSLEYKKRKRVENTRGSSRFSQSKESDYDDDELINVTEEPQHRNPVVIRIPERVEATHQGRRQSINANEQPYVAPSRTTLPPQYSQQDSRREEQEERRRVVSQSTRPVHRIPDSVDPNQYKNRGENGAIRGSDSPSSYRTNGRDNVETRLNNDYRTRIRVHSSSQEDSRNGDNLRNRYEVATTLRPNRVLNLPTTSKPTRPPKKFRNGTIYSDMTLPIGTDLTNTDAPEPDPSLR